MMESIEMPEQQTSLIWTPMKRLMDTAHKQHKWLPPAHVFYPYLLSLSF